MSYSRFSRRSGRESPDADSLASGVGRTSLTGSRYRSASPESRAASRSGSRLRSPLRTPSPPRRSPNTRLGSRAPSRRSRFSDSDDEPTPRQTRATSSYRSSSRFGTALSYGGNSNDSDSGYTGDRDASLYGARRRRGETVSSYASGAGTSSSLYGARRGRDDDSPPARSSYTSSTGTSSRYASRRARDDSDDDTYTSHAIDERRRRSDAPSPSSQRASYASRYGGILDDSD